MSALMKKTFILLMLASLLKGLAGGWGGGGGGGISVGRARDSWWGGTEPDSRCDHPLPAGWVGVSIMWPAETEIMVSQLCLMCGSS